MFRRYGAQQTLWSRLGIQNTGKGDRNLFVFFEKLKLPSLFHFKWSNSDSNLAELLYSTNLNFCTVLQIEKDIFLGVTSNQVFLLEKKPIPILNTTGAM